MDEVFKALAAASRRSLRTGFTPAKRQTLNELCDGPPWTRQVSHQPLGVLEGGQLRHTLGMAAESCTTSSFRSIRSERWIKKFERESSPR